MTRYFTIKEVAEILRCNRATVAINIRRGKLKAHRIDNGNNTQGRKTYRISQDQIDEFLKNSIN